MQIAEFIFYLIATMILVFSMLAVTTKNIFHAAIYLLFSLINVAALYFYLNFEFIAAVQIVVYVGGIVVLILFSLFLTHKVDLDLPAMSWHRTLLTFLLCLMGFAFTFSLVIMNQFESTDHLPVDLSVAYIGRQMLNYGDGGFVLPFEVVSVLLLAALIGSIAVALKTKKNA